MRKHRAPALALAVALALLGFGPTVLPAQAKVTARLPDLAVVAPYNFRIQVTSTGRRLLRFTSVIVNIGKGPFQIYGYDEDGVATKRDSLRVRQQILQSDGSWRVRNTTATMAWADDGHNHFHVADLQRFELQTLSGAKLKSTKKTGFCFLDSYRYGSKKAAKYTRAISVCNIAPNKRVPMGVSIRWGDIYKAAYAFQWIDITGLASGDYLIKVIADPPTESGGRFLESNEANNRGWAKIHLTKKTVTVLSKSARP